MNNTVRHVEGATDPGGYSFAIQLNQVDNVLVEHNVIALENPESMGHYTATSVRYFRNTDPAGNLVQGVQTPNPDDPVPPQRRSELSTMVEDALLLNI